MEDSYDCYTWINKTDNYHLRKNDILSMKEGEKIDLLLLDKNVFENIELDIPLYHKYRANVFFKDNKITFVKGSKNLEGTLLFINYKLSKKVELHFEYKKNTFQELVNGKLKQCLDNGKDTDTFELENDNYKVGWRGYMIPWKYINELPCIYLVDINKNDNNNENKSSPELIDKTNYLTEDTIMATMGTPFKLDI